MRNPILAGAALIAGVTAAAAVLSGCLVPGLEKQPGATSKGSHPASAGASAVGLQGGNPSPTADRIQAFKSTLYPYLTQNCAGCHATEQSPKFAQQDAATDYPIARGLVDFANVANSTYLRKVKDGHCGARCSTDGTAMSALITQWKQLEDQISAAQPSPSPGAAAAPSGPTTLTAALPLPNPLPTGNSYMALRWQLSSATPANPDLNGAIFEIQVQRFTAKTASTPGSYRFRMPKLATPTNAIHVAGIKVLVNGKYDPTNSNYTVVDSIVSPGTIPDSGPLPFPVLSPDTMIVLQDQDSDQITISFDTLQKTAAPQGCKSLTLFQQNVLPVMQNSCTGCHGDPNSGAGRVFDMGSGQDADICARSLLRVNKASPASSVLITNPLNGTNGHDVIDGFSGSSQSWIDWINAEK